MTYILNAYLVSEHIVIVCRVGILRLIDSFYRNLNAIGYSSYHEIQLIVNDSNIYLIKTNIKPFLLHNGQILQIKFQ